MTDTTEKPAEQPQTLLTALLAVQAEIPSLKLGKTGEGQIAGNKDYKYLTLNHLMAEVLPLLSKHGLVWITKPLVGVDGPVLDYELVFAEAMPMRDADGYPRLETVQGTFPLMLDKNNSQGLGSAITYARRYALTAVLGLTPDEDDDGAAASKSEKTKVVKRDPEADRPCNDEELATLLAAVKNKEANLDLLLASVGAEGTPSVGQAREMFRRLNA